MPDLDPRIVAICEASQTYEDKLGGISDLQLDSTIEALAASNRVIWRGTCMNCKHGQHRAASRPGVGDTVRCERTGDYAAPGWDCGDWEER